MVRKLIQRSVSITLAAVLTLGMLGSVDHLAQPEDASAAQWAQRAASAPRG